MILNAEWNDRIQHWIRTLKADFYTPIEEIHFEAHRTDRHYEYKELKSLAFEAVNPGYTWGETWEYCWFRGKITLPGEAQGKKIVLNLQPRGESALFVNGQEFGTYRADWVAQPHHFMVDNILTEEGLAGNIYEICMETYAGHYFPNCETGYCATGPVLPGSFQDPQKEGERRVLGKSTYGIWREEAYQLFLDVNTLFHLLEVLDGSSLRAYKIAEALKRFTYDVDFEQDESGRAVCYAKARLHLQKVLAAENGTTAPRFWAVGNAHLDLAWLWPLEETKRKTARTFAAQLRLLDQYPQYRFIQSQPAAYEMCRQHYPGLFQRIQEKIARGQWIADGAMWVEPDTNMAGGEALIRQLLYGKKYYKEVLGVDSRVLWLPDTFGYTAALPQILLGCDVPYLVTQKIFWCCNDGERFPYHYFYWEGLDGSRVTSFLPTSYTYQTDPQEVGTVWNERQQKEDLETFLFPFGYGDGGGGPTRDHIEYVLRQENLEGSPRMQMGAPEEFFKMMDAEGGPGHTYCGELYFSSHRGTYTSQAQVKNHNRRCELAMREMEIWSSLALIQGMAWDHKRAESLWKSLLFQQFHDILPGSSIERVYQETEAAHNSILEAAAEMTYKAAAFLTSQGEDITVLNSLSFPRNVLVELPERYKDGAVTAEGKAVPVQKDENRVLACVQLPSCGWITLKACSCENEVPEERAVEIKQPRACAWLDEAGCHMENEYASVLINECGHVISYILKCSKREMAAGEMNRLRLFKDVPRHFDAWDIDDNYLEQETDGAYGQEIKIMSQGLQAVVKVSGRISQSTYVQYIRLDANQQRLEFETIIEWQELHRLLKAAFPVSLYALNAKNEMQFGYVERPTHRSRTYDKDRFEVCNHRYTALCDNGHGAAILNDCKYGISVEGNQMELTLLRAASSPHMRADNGTQHFTYAFYAWEGSFVESDVIRQGYELNVKPQMIRGTALLFEFIQMNRKNILMETLKPAEDNSRDLILRLYEAAGAAVSTEVKINQNVESAWSCNMLEQNQEVLEVTDGVLRLNFRAFEIKNIRLRM